MPKMKSPPPCSTLMFLFATLMLAPQPSDCGNLGDIPSPGDLLANLPSLPEIFNILSKLKTTLDIRLRPHVAIDVVNIQPADIGWPTGNGKKLSSCQAQLGQATCFAFT